MEPTPIVRVLKLCPAAKLTLGKSVVPPPDTWKPAEPVGTTVPYAIWDVVPVCAVIEKTWLELKALPTVKSKVLET